MTLVNAEGLGTQLRRLLELLDGDLEKIYANDHYNYRPRYTPIMKALAISDGLTIKAIASKSSISHSAASQTISMMEKAGFVEFSLGKDKRERLIRLSTSGRKYLPLLKQRWQATDSAAKELDLELSYSLTNLVLEAIDKLQRCSFAQRIASHESIQKKIDDSKE